MNAPSKLPLTREQIEEQLACDSSHSGFFYDLLKQGLAALDLEAKVALEIAAHGSTVMQLKDAEHQLAEAQRELAKYRNAELPDEPWIRHANDVTSNTPCVYKSDYDALRTYAAKVTVERDMIAAATIEKCEKLCSSKQEEWHDSDEENSGHWMDAAQFIEDAIHKLSPAAIRDELRAVRNVVAAAEALYPYLVDGWDEDDGQEYFDAGNAASDRLIAAIKAARREQK